MLFKLLTLLLFQFSVITVQWYRRNVQNCCTVIHVPYLYSPIYVVRSVGQLLQTVKNI